VVLFVPQGNMRLCIQELPSPQPLNFKRGVGHTERIARGATGRAILAWMEPTAQQLRSYVQGTGIDLAHLQAELALTRKRGYSSSRSELIPGAVAIAVPFFEGSGRVAGSLGVFGPEARVDAARQKEIAQLLLKEGVRLSEALGFAQPAARRA
jgi:DNA-binding IclR family transcriptional regulator